ncbi:MAG TPA: MotA/TolQ/ExbB proton channel family protein [Anaeromyxobacter sp.]|nr:MotA/TolQ/ExbB proton channel family protein [Anaeromyxobacter sp.]
MQQFTLTELWGHMGLFARLVVYVLLLMSLASIVVMAERFVSFLKSNRDSRRFASALAGNIEKSGLDEAAKGKAGAPKSLGHLGRVLSAGLHAYTMTRTARTSPDLTIESVARGLERQAQREQQNLKRGLNLLATVGSTAPFVGLLGTVVGIINAFQQMAATGSGGLATVSAGIAEALVTTALGLLVAIPAVMAYNYMQGWVDARMVDMTESSNELLDHVARKLDEASAAPTSAAPRAV